MQHARAAGKGASEVGRHEKTLSHWIKQQADLTLVELQKRWLEQRAVTISLTALWHLLDRLSLRYKKTIRAAEQ